VVSDKVSELVIGREREIIGLSDLQPDGSVKVDDVEVVGAVTESGKLANDEFPIPKEFPGSVRFPFDSNPIQNKSPARRTLSCSIGNAVVRGHLLVT